VNKPNRGTVSFRTHFVNQNSMPLNLGGIDSFIPTSMLVIERVANRWLSKTGDRRRHDPANERHTHAIGRQLSAVYLPAVHEPLQRTWRCSSSRAQERTTTSIRTSNWAVRVED
jgi:hypothetical protein